MFTASVQPNCEAYVYSPPVIYSICFQPALFNELQQSHSFLEHVPIVAPVASPWPVQVEINELFWHTLIKFNTWVYMTLPCQFCFYVTLSFSFRCVVSANHSIFSIHASV